MDITKQVAKLRLKYYFSMIDFCNVANQLHLMSDDKANMRNKKYFKECLDCYDRLGYNLPKLFINFMKTK